MPVTIRPRGARFDRVILHCARRALIFADYCARLEQLVERLKPGGALMVAAWGEKTAPYGATDLKAILVLFGPRLEAPPNFPGVIRAAAMSAGPDGVDRPWRENLFAWEKALIFEIATINKVFSKNGALSGRYVCDIISLGLNFLSLCVA